MSGLSGRKIKFIALALGVICAIMFAALAYAGFADGSAVSGICFAVLSLVSLIAIYPGYIIGKLVDDVNALDESSRMQNERLFRIQKESEKQNPTDRYSPANRLKINRNTTGTLSADLTETAKTRIMNMPQPTPPPSRQSGEIPSPVAKDFTREIPIPAEKDIAQETAVKTASEKNPHPRMRKSPHPRSSSRARLSIYPDPRLRQSTCKAFPPADCTAYACVATAPALPRATVHTVSATLIHG